MILYDYFRSSSSYRVRIALNLKELDYDIIHVDLVKGEHKQDVFSKKNPQMLVPVLNDDDVTITQSLAILEYIDESYPSPPLLYGGAEDKAYIRQMSYIIACEIHPLNNLRVWKGYLGGVLGAEDKQLSEWYDYWIRQGLRAYESFLSSAGKKGMFTCGDRISMADICLIPQLYNARRFGVCLEEFPLIRKIELNCIKNDAFVRAAPECHANAPSNLEPIHGPKAPLLKEVA